MPFALLIIGLWLLIAGVRNTQDNLFTLVKGDFTGSDNFVFWFLAILLVGAIGYVPRLKPISTGFLVLLLVVLFLKKGSSTGVGGGFFQQFLAGVNGTQTGSITTPQTPLSQSQQIQTQIDNLRQRIQDGIIAERGGLGS